MIINEDQAVANEKFDEMAYYFCSLSCRDSFRKEPGKYAAMRIDLHRIPSEEGKNGLVSPTRA